MDNMNLYGVKDDAAFWTHLQMFFWAPVVAISLFLIVPFLLKIFRYYRG